jgi:thioredoxin 1
MHDRPTLEVRENDFEEKVVQQSGVSVVEFWASWCGPCQEMATIVDELAQDYAGRAIVARVDSDEDRKLGCSFKAHSLPTVLYFCDGTLVDRVDGVVDQEILTRKAEDLLWTEPMKEKDLRLAEAKRMPAAGLMSKEEYAATEQQILVEGRP